LTARLEVTSFAATDKAGETATVNAAYVNERVAPHSRSRTI